MLSRKLKGFEELSSIAGCRYAAHTGIAKTK
jgi:hypothetical protein